MPDEDADTRDLRLLATFHFVVAGLAALFGLFPVIHLVVGIALVGGNFGPPPGKAGGPPPVWFGWVFIGGAILAIGMCWLIAAVLCAGGVLLGRRRRYTFCQVAAGVGCLFNPFGTVLGVFTLIVLSRPGVKRLFAARAAADTSREVASTSD